MQIIWQKVAQGGAAIAIGLQLNCTRLESSKPLNGAPVFASTPPTRLANGNAVKPGLTYVYQATAADADIGDTVTLRMALGPANATFSAGLLRWTPSLDQAGMEQVFKVEASDGSHVTAQTWSITPEARTAPTGVIIAPLTPGNLVETRPFVWTLSFEDDDPGSAIVTIQSPTEAVYVPSNRTIAWTPPVGSAGPMFVQVTVTNNVGQATPKILAGTVNPL